MMLYLMTDILYFCMRKHLFIGSMKRIFLHTCPLCGSDALESAMECKDYYASGETYVLEKCSKCGFLFTQNVPDETEIGRYYETPAYISHSDTRKGLTNSLYHIVRKYMLKRKRLLVEKISGRTNGNLLDYGTGTGYFAQTMKEAGWHVTAIEKSEQARKTALDNFGLQVDSEQTFSQLQSGTFHVITLWHVLEHLQNLNEMWEQLRRQLTSDGHLVVAVPNCQSSDAGYYGNTWAAYDVPRHLWHFSPDTMRQFAEKHGFRLIRTLPMPFDAFYVSILSEKYRQTALPFIKGMCSGLRAWLRACRQPDKSSSLIYVFRIGQ